MLESYKNNQRIFYEYFINSLEKNHILHAYLIETNGVSYAYNLAIDLAKFLLCDGKQDDKICSLIDHGNYPNLRIIGGVEKIKKSDIVELKTEFSMKSLDKKRQVYIIQNAEDLNKSSANSLLKFLEEPEDDVIAIILCNKVNNVLPTIVSRCGVVNLIGDKNVYEAVFGSLYDLDGEKLFNDFKEEKKNEFLKLYSDLEINKLDSFVNNDLYELKDELKEFLIFGYYFYNDVLSYKLNRNIKIDDSANIKKIANRNDVYDIIEKINIIDKFIYNLRYNVNKNLYIDNFIICMGSV